MNEEECVKLGGRFDSGCILTEEQIIKLAKDEINKSNKMGFIGLAKTEEVIKNIWKGKEVRVYGERTWSPFKKKSYSHLVVKVNPDKWNEKFMRRRLE